MTFERALEEAIREVKSPPDALWNATHRQQMESAAFTGYIKERAERFMIELVAAIAKTDDRDAHMLSVVCANFHEMFELGQIAARNELKEPV